MRSSSKIFMVSLIPAFVATVSSFVVSEDAQAIPAFARKYNVNCTVCHSRPPRLNPFGERFLENGYQMPGTEDGGIIGKRRLGDLTLEDTVSNILGFRIRGNAIRNFDFARQSPAAGVSGNPEDRTEIGFPEVFNLYTAGTLTSNVGLFVEMEHDFEQGETEFERTFASFNNLLYYNLAHIRVGRLDPSAFFPFPTNRLQLNPVLPDVDEIGAFSPPVINRIPMTPYAFAAKFVGLFERDGTPILPFQPSLFNAPSEVGIDVHGRPFGDWFLYQFGVLNGANEDFGDSNNPKDWFVMAKFSYARSNLFSADLSGFGYFGSNNAKIDSDMNPATFNPDVSWSRYGVGARITYRMLDLYGSYVIDRVTDLPPMVDPDFDSTATGASIELDALVTDRTLLSIRYDNLDMGGPRNNILRTGSSFLGLQAKYYLRTNIALYIRDDVNLREAEGGTTPQRNLRNAFLVGADLVY